MSSNSSNSSKGEGNTKPPPTSKKKQISPAKRWCFTLNNYDDNDISSISSKFRDVAQSALIGAEVGEEGTPHLQGFIEFEIKCRPTSHGLSSRIHWEKCKGTKEQNLKYCSKEGNVIFEFGLPKPLVLLNECDMYPYQKMLLAYAEKDIEDRGILWIYGDKNIGKTQVLKVLCNPNGVYKASILPTSRKHALAQVQRAELCETFVFNLTADESLYQTNSMFSIIESLKDGLFSTAFGTDNNSMCVRNSSRVIVVANNPPDGRKTEIDRNRFKIFEVSRETSIEQETSIMDDWWLDKCIFTEGELNEIY
jgi:hypothetical protein